MSEAVEAALEQVIRAAERERWLRENADAIADYNAVVERRGVFSDDWRRF
jgi:antitoxin CcdA